MIRKAIIVVLTLSAIGAGTVWVTSFKMPNTFSWFQNDASWVEVSIIGGNVEILVIEGKGFQFFRVFVQGFERSRTLLRERHGKPPTAKRLALILPSGLQARGTIIPFGPLFFLFAAYPTLAFIRGPLRRYRRRKRGLCVKCGYNLTGLMEPRCPECGTKIKS